MSFLSGGSLPDSWSLHNFSRPKADGNFDGPVMDSIEGLVAPTSESDTRLADAQG